MIFKILSQLQLHSVDMTPGAEAISKTFLGMISRTSVVRGTICLTY